MSKHIVIIGSGVIGLSTAYYCAQRGHHVTVLERNPITRDGCSYGNAGMIVPSHFVPLAAPGMVLLGLKWMWNPESPFYIEPRLDWDLLDWAFKFWRASTRGRVKKAAPLLRDLNYASRECFEELASKRDDFGLVKKGLLMYCKTQEALDHEAQFAQQANDLDVPAQVLDASQASAFDPKVTVDVAGAVYFPEDAHLSPDKFMASLQARCVEAGVKFGWEHEVLSINKNANQITSIYTTRGEFTGDEYVLCGGSWSQELAQQLDLRIPLQAGKGYSLTLPTPPELPTLCSIFTEARLAITPMGTSLRIGGTMEIAGLNEAITPLRVRGIVKSVPRYFSKFAESDFDGVKPWRGLRPCSPDGLPYVGRTAKFANLSIATGHAMMGLSLGPVTGRIVSRVIDGEDPGFPLKLLSPDRYC